MCQNVSAVVLIIHFCICVTEEELKLQSECSLQMASWPSENVNLEKQKLIRDAFMVFLANTLNM